MQQEGLKEHLGREKYGDITRRRGVYETDALPLLDRGVDQGQHRFVDPSEIHPARTRRPISQKSPFSCDFDNGSLDLPSDELGFPRS
jgi:hypothetical protein